MPKLFDRVKVNIPTTGTGTVTFGPASSPAFLTPDEAGAVDGNTVRYVIVDGTDFEEGEGTILASVEQMARTTVTRSKIGGSLGAAKINLSGTAVLVFTAGAADILNPANNLSDLTNAATARGNLGLGSAATQASSAFLQPGNNLSDLGNPATARTNLGGSAVGKAVFTAADAATARTALGAGSASVRADTDFPRTDVVQALSVSVQRQTRENISAALRGHLVGFKISNNTVSPNWFVDITSGECASDEANPQFMAAAAMTKRLDNGWAPGTNAGMRNSAAALAAGWYHLYAVSKANGADADYYAHTSANVATILTALQAESGGAAYVHARRIFTLWNQGSSIRPFFHHGDTVKWATPVADITSTAAATDALTTLTIPPGIRTRPILHTYHFQGTVGDTYYSYGDGDGAVSNVLVGRSFANTEAAISLVDAFVSNLSSQIRRLVVINSGTIGTHVLNNLGYHDTRGRFGAF